MESGKEKEEKSEVGKEEKPGGDGVGADTSANRSVIEELREQNKILEKNLERAERIQAERLVSGRSDAGQDKTPKELTPKEYKDKVMAGEVP